MKHFEVRSILPSRRVVLAGFFVVGLTTALQAESPFDAGGLATLEREARDPGTNLHSLLIERGGRIQFEMYRNGADETLDSLGGLGTLCSSETKFDANTLHDVRSVSKSITSLLWGIPEYQRILPDLGSSVLSHYPDVEEFQELPSSEKPALDKRRITVRNLFQMNSGLAWEEWVSPVMSDELRLLWKSSHVSFLMDRSLVHEPGQKFNYNGGGTAVLADLLVRTTGKPLIDIAREKLFDPLEIKDFKWALDLRDRPMPHAGLRLRPRDMMKIGRLVLNGGVWNGKQIIRRDWIEISTRSHLDTGVTLLSGNEQSMGYGYQWWTGSSVVKGKQIDWTTAVGNGGQRIFVVPSFDLVVVTTAGDYGKVAIQGKIGRLFERVLEVVQ
ncbi:MAG: serine hydrolase [Leptospirales bacterium]|nr:serine hydrolase [Leptospirales bacterium]